MIFSIIYSVDIPKNVRIGRYLPSQRHLFDMTEGNEQYEYSYLGEDWEKGKHRKLAALLTKKQFERFLSDCGLFAQNIETMGSLGAPGFGFGWAPAISFIAETNSAILNAYVTPIPEPVRKKKQFDEKDWQRIRKAIIRKYS